MTPIPPPQGSTSSVGATGSPGMPISVIGDLLYCCHSIRGLILLFMLLTDGMEDERLDREKARVFFGLFIDHMLHRAGEEFYEMYKAREDLLSGESSPVTLPRKRKAGDEEPSASLASLSPPTAAGNSRSSITTSPERSSSGGENSPESKIPPPDKVKFVDHLSSHNLQEPTRKGSDIDDDGPSIKARYHAASSARQTLLKMAGGGRGKCKSEAKSMMQVLLRV